MITMRGEIKGLREFKNTLAVLPERVEKRVMRSAIVSAARVALNAVKRAAPVDDTRSGNGRLRKLAGGQKIDYGTLKNNLRVFRARYDVPRGVTRAIVDLGSRRKKRQAFWAYFLEYGTRNMAARPFFRPAIASAQPKVAVKIQQMVFRGIEREFNRLKK